MPEIYAPWTPQQVAALNAFQERGGMHPFTCGNVHTTHVELIAHEDGWHCPDPACGYRQKWAHAFMVDKGQAALDADPDDTDLTEAQIDQMMENSTPATCMHTEPGTPCDWDVCRQPERLASGDDGEPHSAAYLRLKAAGAKAMDEAKLHALHGMKRVYQLARRYGDEPIPAAEVLDALGLDRDANTVESLVKHRPARGDEFATWLKAQRALYLDGSTGWNVMEDLLDTYRLHTDTGTPLDGHVCEGLMVGECGHLEGTS